MYGFVYLWYDVKRKMFYIGSRWGNVNDGYICSSVWMKRAFKRRPQDFKRRILSTQLSEDTVRVKEREWLGRIQDHELGSKYYNLHRGTEHWSTEPTRKMSVREKLKASWTEDRKQKAKITQSLAWNDERREVFKAKTTGRKRTMETKQKQSAKWTPDRKEKQAERLRAVTNKRFENYWDTHLTPKEKLAKTREETGWLPTNLSEKSKRSWQKVKSNSLKLEQTKLKMAAAKLGKVWVVNEAGPKLVLPAELEAYLQQGWLRGRTLNPGTETLRKRKG